MSIGQVIGAITGGFLGGKYGPKKTIQVSCLIAIPAWALLAVSPNLLLLIFGRLICGFADSLGTANGTLLVAQYRLVKQFKQLFCFTQSLIAS